MQLTLDSLRHWVTAYGVAGFRFDLATSLGRVPHDFSAKAAFFQAVAQDPVLSRVKMIAEPWDIGQGGYQLGAYPRGWSEWNDQFRDSVRGFWRGDRGVLSKVTQGLSGSREIFAASGRTPLASINYAASHDGFTLADVVAYEDKHNLANGEDNCDGHGHNLTRNYGVEGPSDDPAILGMRARQKRNILATVFLAQGVPMLLMGDERSRSQGGNNNAYNQDNATNWVDWETDPDPALGSFVANLTRLRREQPALRRRDFLDGGAVEDGPLRDVHWLSPCGAEMDGNAWAEETRQAFGMQIGNDLPDADRLLILVNAAEDPCDFTFAPVIGGPWSLVFDTTRSTGTVPEGQTLFPAGARLRLDARALYVLRTRPATYGRS